MYLNSFQVLFPLFAQLDLPSANEEDEKALAAAAVSNAKGPYLYDVRKNFGLFAATPLSCPYFLLILHSSPLVRSMFCPKKIDHKSGLTLYPGYWLL